MLLAFCISVYGEYQSGPRIVNKEETKKRKKSTNIYLQGCLSMLGPHMDCFVQSNVKKMQIGEGSIQIKFTHRGP